MHRADEAPCLHFKQKILQQIKHFPVATNWLIYFANRADGYLFIYAALEHELCFQNDFFLV